MNTLSSQFNVQARWEMTIWPLYVLIMLDDIERRKKRHRAFVSKLQSSFQESSTAQSREQYRQQVQARYSQPRYRITAPGF